MLIAESEVPVTFKTERKCKVLTGRWTCPYTGDVFTSPRTLDVDHMVPLGAAHASGGHAWDAMRRRAFANELGVAHHLIAVKASANRSKGKRGQEKWHRRDIARKDKKQCKVLSGRWTCPYTGEVFTDPRKLDVDHMIPLAAAHAAGGHAWDAERKKAFANELGQSQHLIAVKASAKGMPHRLLAFG